MLMTFWISPDKRLPNMIPLLKRLYCVFSLQFCMYANVAIVVTVCSSTFCRCVSFAGIVNTTIPRNDTRNDSDDSYMYFSCDQPPCK